MKNVYIALIVGILAMAFGQYSNANGTFTTKIILEDYYGDYTTDVKILRAHPVQPRRGLERSGYCYGDDNVGYYRSQEEYGNMYDPAINAVE